METKKSKKEKSKKNKRKLEEEADELQDPQFEVEEFFKHFMNLLVKIFFIRWIVTIWKPLLPQGKNSPS